MSAGAGNRIETLVIVEQNQILVGECRLRAYGELPRRAELETAHGAG
jgi:hypothetical protein